MATKKLHIIDNWRLKQRFFLQFVARRCSRKNTLEVFWGAWNLCSRPRRNTVFLPKSFCHQSNYALVKKRDFIVLKKCHQSVFAWINFLNFMQKNTFRDESTPNNVMKKVVPKWKNTPFRSPKSHSGTFIPSKNQFYHVSKKQNTLNRKHVVTKSHNFSIKTMLSKNKVKKLPCWQNVFI